MRKFEKAETILPWILASVRGVSEAREGLPRQPRRHRGAQRRSRGRRVRGQGGMKIGVTRFADLTEEEFSKHPH